MLPSPETIDRRIAFERLTSCDRVTQFATFARIELKAWSRKDRRWTVHLLEGPDLND